MDNPNPDLESSLGPAEWSILRPHFVRGAVFLVSNSLDLLTVARRIAGDDTTQVAAWLNSGNLTRPTEAQARDWDATPSKTFQSIIVAPYVLMQEISN
jgi:hypothetical protein